MNREWDSIEGRRHVAGVHATGKLMLTNPSLNSFDLVDEKDLDRTIDLDTRKLQSHLKMQERVDKAKEEERVEDEARKALHGFQTKMSSMQQKRVEDTLNKQISVNRKVVKAKAFIEDAVREGAIVRDKHGERILEFPDGRYFNQRAPMSKTMFDYAEYLIRIQF